MRLRSKVCAAASALLLCTAATPPLPRSLAPIPIFMLADMSSGQVLAAREPATRFLPASITKVMTEYVAFEAISRGDLDLKREFVVSDDVARVWRWRITGLALAPKTTIDTDTLLHAIATVSANDAAEVFAEGYGGSVPGFSVIMNATAQRLGMRDSTFASPNGWPDGGLTMVSARDLVTLADAMIRKYPALYHRYFGVKSMTYNGRTQFNHDPTLGIVPGADGIKTGHTNAAGYTFLGSAERGGRRLVMVLGGVPSPQQRAIAARELMEWGFAEWRSRRMFRAGATIGEARVQGGDRTKVPLVAAGPVFASMPAGTTQPVTLTLRYAGPLAAPIAKGTQVAQLDVAVLGQPTSSIPLYAASNVGRADWLQRLRNGLVGLL
jgi:D-alanyl-D-alanine carboxypeptidase (penicillin-binding protein 5/6)